MAHTDYQFVLPPIESLLEGVQDQSLWPKGLMDTPRFNRQLLEQQSLLQALRSIFASLPISLTLAEGLSQGFVSESQVISICEKLAEQLERNEAQKRMVLYLPFELLAPVENTSTAVQKAVERLHQAYRLAWEAQLLQHEVRENYACGDVLELELLQGDHPRVVKAAHLIPSLLRVGHLSVAEVLEYQRHTTDPILQCSISDACMVAADLGLFPYDEILLRACEEDPIQDEPSVITPGRARWLASVVESKERAQKAASLVSKLMAGHHVSTLTDDLPLALQAVRIAALQNGVVFETHREWIECSVSTNESSAVRDELITLLAHLYATGVASESCLQTCGISLPSLSGSFAANLSRMQPDKDYVLGTCQQISRHQNLNQLVYPVALIFGSQIKGYGLTEADCDVAVFVRPGVDRDKRNYLEQELSQIYRHERIGGKVMLFWLKEDGDGMYVIDWAKRAPSDGGASWLHVLFGALWFGETSSIKLLHERLLVSYFSAPKWLLLGKPVYVRWLEEMERDSLQYRLLHKGFGRYYPIRSLMETQHGHLIDGQAAFYDSQYRRIATELFVRRVWLPCL